MKRTRSIPPQNPQGSALVLSLIFIAVFSALAAALGTIAGSNVQLANNYRRADATRCSAESGLEVIRYWLSRVDMSGTIAPGERFNHLASTFQSQLTGTVDSHPVTELPQETQFDGLHGKLGTFIMAPGCAVSFSGSFSTLNGAIAANGVSFSGNAGGMIRGSVLNYANTAMELNGSSDLLINRSPSDQVPAGFVPRIVMRYDQSSYTEAAI